MLKKDFYILEKLNPGIIFEFGAFDGEDTSAYRKAFPEATIYSFEPDPILYRSLRSRMRLLNIHFYNYAISDITGQADFWYMTGKKDRGERGPAGSLFPYTGAMFINQKDKWHFPTKPIKVDMITIKDFCREEGIAHINYMHMDVEGAVPKVLAGMGDLRPELILAEVKSRDVLFQGALNATENIKIFALMGYKPVGGRAADILFKLKTE